MRFLRLIGAGALVAGAALIGVGIYQGEVEVALFLIFPVLVSTGGTGALGMVLLALGIMALVFEAFLKGRVAEEGDGGGGTEGRDGALSSEGWCLSAQFPSSSGPAPGAP